MNPLLDFSGLPRFAALKPEHVAPAIGQLLAECRAAVARARRAAPVWDEFVAPLDDANERLQRAWGQVAHLHGVLDTPPLREAYNAALPQVTQYWTELEQDEILFQQYLSLQSNSGFENLSAARKRIVHNRLRDFRLGGAELPPEKKARFAAIQEELARLGSRFAENLLDATNAFTITVKDEARVAGIPPDVREAARQDGGGWRFTLQAPSYTPVMQYAEDRALRETMYREQLTRASEFGKPDWDNTPLIARIVRLRREAAALLGFRNFAELSLEPKMAESPRQVIEFLEDLAGRARPFAERERAELEAIATRELRLERLQAWDLAFCAEKLRAKRFAFSEQEVKPYFPETQVLPGLFALVERLFGAAFVPAQAETWHEDVRFYELRDAAGARIGQLYVDLYARETKRGGAWMDEAIARRRRGAGIQAPVAHLTCNFTPPHGGRPSLLTHDEVLTLAHELGHCLHHLLTRVEELGVSGLSGVEWDAVELPSQFLENFCWEWEVLRGMSRHADTGEPLPRALYDKLRAAKNFNAGLDMLRQIEFALFDMRLHGDFDPDAGASARELLDQVRREIAVIVPPDYNRFLNGFAHVFGGGYAAGYYSYKWAEVLSADAFAAFEERGVLDAATGARFRDEILAVGGSRPAAESFRAFRGREPKIDALLRLSGMIAA